MKIAVIDTHVLIWHLSQPTKLAPPVKRFRPAVDQGDAHILIPAIVLIELTLLREAGRRVVGPADIALRSVAPAIGCHPPVQKTLAISFRYTAARQFTGRLKSFAVSR